MKSSYYWKVTEILKQTNAKVRRCLTQQLLAFPVNIFLSFFVKCKIISLFLWSCERVWHIIIANISICNCTAEYPKQKTIIQKLLICLLGFISMYFVVTTFVCAVFLALLTKFVWSMLNNFVKWHQKPFILEKRIISLRIQTNLQNSNPIQILSDSSEFDLYPKKF